METKKTQCHPNLAVTATCLLGEKGCYKNGKCHYIGNCEHKVLTNADRIRAMSDEELADAWMKDVAPCHRCVYTEECECDEYVTIEKCKEGLLKWLKQPVEVDNG